MSKLNYSNKIDELQMMLETLAYEANKRIQFSQRKRELNAERFVQVLVLGLLEKGDASLNQLAAMSQKLGCQITGAAIQERLTPKAVELLAQVLRAAMQRSIGGDRLPIQQLQQFRGIYITDSTQLSLPLSVRDHFAGSHQDAMLKLQVTLDYMTGQWTALELVEGKSPDQKSDLPVKQACEGSLNLFDLGYFKQDRLKAIVEQGAYFVSRYQSQTAIYHQHSGQRIDLVPYLQSLPTTTLDLPIRLGANVQVPLRLVARRLTPAQAAARRRKAKCKAQAQGKTCSQAYLRLLEWDILITNLAAATWTLEQIFDLYAIRTQIEWIFRVWKSHLRLDHFGNWQLERVLCQLYAHLIGILLCHQLMAGWWWDHDIEYSFAKCVSLFQGCSAALMHCIRRNWYGIHAWMKRLEDSFKRFGQKTKRLKKPSTFQTLLNWSYLDA